MEKFYRIRNKVTGAYLTDDKDLTFGTYCLGTAIQTRNRMFISKDDWVIIECLLTEVGPVDLSKL